MIEKTGSLFDTDAHCIGHGVNCVGVMGAGIAKQFRERYPQNYLNYKHRCDKGVFYPGAVYAFPFEKVEPTRYIFNIASQNQPGPNATYSALFNGCNTAANRAAGFGYDRIAIPQIGCGIGGLQWDNVKTLLEAIEILTPKFQWEVWTLG